MKKIPFTENACLNILLVEDSETDIYTVRRILGQFMKRPCRVNHVDRMADAEALLRDEQNSFDVILLDLGLPDTDGGKDTFARVESVKEDIPVIILTDLEDHELAVNIVGEGAEDYVRKSMMADAPEALCDAIDFAVCRHRNMAELKNRKDRELEEKDKVIQWMTGGYSVEK